MDKPLLTIGIPTWNRARVLPESLTAIFRAIEQSGHAEEMEVVVSDNDSTDNTAEVVSQFQNKFKNFRYLKNPENLEFDRNVYNVLKQARGQWCWTLSDDEIIQPRALEFLWPLLLSYPDVSRICINHGGDPQTKDIEYYKDGNAWLGHMDLAGGLLSQNIFRVSSLPTNMEKYFDNYWMHLSIALEMMAHSGCLLVKSLFLPPALVRKVRMVRNDQVFDNYDHLRAIIKNLPTFGYSQELINKKLRNFARGLPMNLASARLHGLPISTSYIKRFFKDYSGYPLWLFLSLCVYFMPVFLLRIAKKFKL